VKKLFTGVIIAALSVIGVVGVSMATASAGGARHVASYPPTQARNLPPDQVIIIRCASLGSLQGDVGRLDNYQKGMSPAGAWIEGNGKPDWWPADQFDAQYRSLVCVAISVTPPTPPTTVAPETTTTTPVVTTLPSHPEHPCPYDVADCQPYPVPCLLPFNDHDRVAAGNYGGEPGFLCEPHHHPVPPIATTTTTVEETTTTEAPTTTVPVPVTHCIIVRRVQICTLPHETTTTVEQTTTTEAPTTSTTVEECPPGEHPEHHYGDQGDGDHIVCVPDHPIVTTTTEAPTTSTTEETTTTEAPETTTTVAPEGPCTGIDDCHIVCNDAAGVDDCNICIGNGSCDVIECPVGYELDSQGDCDVVAPPIATTTTVPVATTLPATTTTEASTTTTAEVTPHHYGH
jgi:hypothetical protein